jgi:hypothetical protein
LTGVDKTNAESNMEVRYIGYTAYERETTILGNDEDRIWEVYTAQPMIMTKLRKAGVEPYWTETEPNEKGEPRIIAAKYKLEWRQISILSKNKRKGNPKFKEYISNSKSVEQSM